MDTPDSSRNGHGRFAEGNAGGPGRPRGSASDLRRAAEEAVTPEHVAAIIKKATILALQGNLAAMRLVLERTCGRVAEAPAEGLPLDITPPKLQTLANCIAALDRVLEAVCQGTIDRESAKLLVDVINARIKAIEATVLEARITELEKAAATVDFGGRR